MSDVFKVNGTTITLANHNAGLDRCVPIIKGGIPELHFSRILGPLKPSGGAALPDPWSAQPVTLAVGSGPTLIFAGDCVGYVDRFMRGVGWVREYRALGLRNRADYIPNTDAITLTDTSVFNLPTDDLNYVGARAGLTCGAIISAILKMPGNAAALNAAGIGAYTSLGPPAVLPSLTVSDLAAMTVIPPWRVSISGERILQALESFAQSVHPNHWLHIQPDGTIRFLDQRLANPNTITIGTDPRQGLPTMTRDYADSYSQVEVRGNTTAVPVILQTLPWEGSADTDGGLQEAFEWGSFATNAAAIAAWTPAQFNQPGSFSAGNAQGTCTVVDATHVTVTCSNTLQTWAANFWGQSSSEAQGSVYLYGDAIPGIGQYASAKVIANTALTAGGTSTLTLDPPLTSLVYNSFKLWGLAFDGSIVFRKYKLTNTNVAASLLNYFPYPVAVQLAVVGNAAWVTSSIQGFVQVPEVGSSGPPYITGGANITVDPVGGFVYFDRPTAFIVNQAAGSYIPPYNVVALLSMANGALKTIVPSPTTYSGTLFSVEGVSRTKVITVRDWSDASNLSNMTTFATEFLESVQDVVVEGSVPYFGLLSLYLTCGSTGQAVSITGNDSVTAYTTGWEALALPVVSVELVFNCGAEGTSYQTNLQLSNRRGRYTADQFLRPNIVGSQLGMSGDTFSGATNVFQEAGQAKFQAKAWANTANATGTDAAIQGANQSADKADFLQGAAKGAANAGSNGDLVRTPANSAAGAPDPGGQQPLAGGGFNPLDPGGFNPLEGNGQSNLGGGFQVLGDGSG